MRTPDRYGLQEGGGVSRDMLGDVEHGDEVPMPPATPIMPADLNSSANSTQALAPHSTTKPSTEPYFAPASPPPER